MHEKTATPTAKPCTILLIDDSAEDRAAYCRYLQRGSARAYQILEASSAAAGLDLYQRLLPDAILLDYSLPDMDGLEFLAVMQRTGKQRIPVLMLTGQGDETIAAQAIKSNAQDYLIKGHLTADGLCKALEHAIEQFQLQQRLAQQELQQQMLSAIALSIRQSLQLEEILEATVTEVRQFLNADRMMIYQFQPDMSGSIITEAVLPGWRVSLGEQVQDTCFQHNAGGDYRAGKHRAIDDIYHAGLTPCHVQLLERFEVKANLVAPIIVKGDLWGLLIAHQCSAPRQWQTTELDLLDQLVVQIAIAIQQATAYQQAQAELVKRQHIEAILRESEQRYATLTEMSPVGIFQTDALGNCLYVNERWCQIAGLNPTEAMGFGWVNGIHPDDRERVSTEWYAAAQADRPFHLEYRFQNAAGQMTWVLGQAAAERDVSGVIVGYVGTVTDISEQQAALHERKQAAQALSQLAAIVESSTDAIISKTLDGVIVSWNKGAEKLFGYTAAEAIGRSILLLIPAAFRNEEAAIARRLKCGEPIEHYETVRQHKDGRLIDVSLTVSPLKDVTGTVIGGSKIARDISVRKQIEAERKQTEITLQQLNQELETRVQERTAKLQASEARLQEAQRIAHLGSWELALATQKITWSEELFRLFGLDASQGEPEYAEHIQSYVPESCLQLERAVQQAATLGTPYELELQFSHADGSVRWLLARGEAVRDVNGAIVKLLGTALDITDRKLAEQAIAKYTHEVEDLYNNAPCGYHSLDGDGRFLAVNDTELHWLGYTRAEILGKSFADISTEASWRLFQTNYPVFKQRGLIQDVELDLVCKDGTLFPIFLSATAVKDAEGNYLHSRSTLYDAHDRKQFEASLTQYERIISSTRDGVALLDCHYIYQVANQAYLTWCDKTHDDVIGHSVRDVLGAELFDNFVQPRLDQCLSGQMVQYEKWFDYPNLVPQFLSVTYTPYLDANQTIAGMIVSLRDITDRKQAEIQLQHLSDRLTLAVKSGAIGIWDWNITENILTWDDRMYELYGITPDQFTSVNETWASSLHPDDRPLAETAVQQALTGEKDYDPEFRVVHSDGTIRFIKAFALVQRNEQGEPQQMIGINFDVTDRKQTEDLLRKSDAHLKTAQRIAALGSWEFDLRTEQITWSEEVFRIFGRNPEAQPPAFEALQQLIHPDDRDRHQQAVQTAIATIQPYELEFRFYDSDGSLRSVYTRGEPIVDTTGQIIQLVGTVLDITDRKEAEVALRESERRLATLAIAAPVAIFRFDAAVNCVYVNDRWSEMTGRPAAEGLGAKWVEAIHPQDREWISSEVAQWLQTCKAGDLYRNEARILRPDGSILWYFCQMLPETDFSGTITGYVGTLTDITDRKDAEEELRNLSDRLTLAVQSGAIAIWDWNVAENILTWDDRMYALYGITPNAFTSVYEAWANSLHPDDRPFAEADILKALAGEKAYEHEFRVIHPDGTVHFIKAYALVQRNEQGEPQQMIGINYDITDLKQTEAQLRKLSDRMALAVKSGTIGIWEWNSKNNQINCDERMYKLYGITPDPLTSFYEGWISRLHPDDRPLIEAALQQALAGEKDYDSEFRVIHPDGTVHFIKAYALVQRNAQGEPQQMIGINYDITTRKQAELENQQLKERLQLVLASSPAVTFTCEPEGDYAATFISDNIQDVVGHTPADFLAESSFWANHIHPEDAPRIFAGLATLFAQGHHAHEYRFLHKNGSYRWMCNGLRLVRDAEANVIEIVGYFVDITDRKQAEQALQQLTIDLQRSNQELEQFAYVASHDLQEPLRAITSYTQLLAKRYQGQLDEKADKYIYYVVDGAARMQQLIHDLLAYSRVGRYELKLRPTDCNAILEQVRNDLQVAIAESNAVITVDALPTIPADTAQVTQLFQNLVGNALKYRGQAPPIIKISVRQQGKEWAFSIQDNGIGIDPQYAERIFEIFQRLHTRREYEGTGLGLAICKKIVERHHGRIWVESTLEQGAAFCFTLPASLNHEYSLIAKE